MRIQTQKDSFYKFSSFLKEKFGEKVYKISIHAGFTCPNIDGTLATGGCTYCYNPSFSPNMSKYSSREIREQIQNGIREGKEKGIQKFIAYFQSFTNTYDTPERLKEKYDVILEFKEVVGLAIGTRPDCIDLEKLKLINQYTKTHMVWLEYGLQTIHNKTLQAINRQDTRENFFTAIDLTQQFPDIYVCVHVILGLPGESWEEMMETAEAIAPLPIHGAKIHNIHLVKQTELEKMYHEGKYQPIELDSYIEACCDFLERIPESIVIHRLIGDAPPDLLVRQNDWCLQKHSIINAIEEELAKRGTYQGFRYQ